MLIVTCVLAKSILEGLHHEYSIAGALARVTAQLGRAETKVTTICAARFSGTECCSSEHLRTQPRTGETRRLACRLPV